MPTKKSLSLLLSLFLLFAWTTDDCMTVHVNAFQNPTAFTSSGIRSSSSSSSSISSSSSSRTTRRLSSPSSSTSAVSSSTSATSDIAISPFGEDASSILKASQFMLESFWIPLSQQQQQQRYGENASAATVPVASSMNSSKLLTSIQDDFTSRYGEIMGRRKLQSCLLSATTTPTTNDNDNNNNNKPLVGIIAMDMTLVDETNEIQYTRLEAEQTLTKAISSLGPKERREYSRKDCTVHEIVSGLLPNLKVAVVLSNLAVCQSQRQKGIGMELCNYVHDFAKTTWGMEYVYLRVEADNTAARKLYEEKLGYQCCWVEKDAIALRADVMTGEFQEMEKDTWSLCKQL